MIAYSQVSIQDLQNQFGIRILAQDFLPEIQPITPPDWLLHLLKINRLSPAMTKSEKAVSEAIIAPILFAVKERHADHLAIFSGEPLQSDVFSGICDFILASNPNAYLPEPPIMVIVEAKKQDLYAGIPQCAAEMLTARQLNKTDKVIYGCVTTGTDWLFVMLDGNLIKTHGELFSIKEIDKIIGIFDSLIVQFEFNSRS